MDIEKSDSQNIVGINKREWDKMRIRGMHVDTKLIEWHKKFFPIAKSKKLLEVGFGEGQNLCYFLSQGFECAGTEIAKGRVAFAKKQLAEQGQTADLRLVDSNILPFADNEFDVVVAWESLYYNTEQGVSESLAEIVRALKPGGVFLASLISTTHHMCARGTEIASQTFRPADTESQRACVIYAFADEHQIAQACSMFTNVTVGFQSSIMKGPSDYDFHFIVYGEKPT